MQANKTESAMVSVAQDCIRRAKMRLYTSGYRVDECYGIAKREYAEAQRSFGVHCPALYDQFIDDLCEALDY